MGSNHSSVITGVSATERFQKSCGLQTQAIRRVSTARFLLLILCATLVPWVAAAQTPSVAPLNPAFQEFLAKRQQQVVTLQPNQMSHGAIPPPIQWPVPSGVVPALTGIPLTLPSSYDLRTLGKVTPIRNQDGCGDCWAFATYSSLESCLLTNETWDFSENNLNITSGFDYGCCNGGDSLMSAAYLARWSGPVNESDDPETWTACTTVPGVVAQKHVQQILFLPLRASATDNNTIKQAVMNYGAVYTAILITGGADYLPPYSDVYYNASTYAYYYNGKTPVDHGVAIIGWDDNFAATNFSTRPPGNGAFIMRNSWTAAWGQSGYFYMSYYDTWVGRAENAAFISADPTNNYSRNYQYDPLGWCNSYGYGTTTAWGANIFTAVGYEQLDAVSFYTAAVNSTYQVSVYTNATSGPISGTPASSTSGTNALPGYFTVSLPAPVNLTPNLQFSVVVQFTTPGNNNPIPVEYAISGYSSAAKSAPGQSYFSSDGNSWQDATTWNSTCSVNIKAFTTATGPSPRLAITPTAFSQMVPQGQNAPTQSLGVWNSSDGTINYTISTNAAWLSVSPTTGASSGATNTHTVTFNTAGLTVGYYNALITVSSTNAYKSPQSINVSVAVLPVSGLLGYWTLDEGTGSFAYDYSGNGNTGTVIIGDGNWTSGMVSNCLFFGGPGSPPLTQVTVSNSVSLNPVNGITLAAWVNDASGGWYNTPRIIEKGASDNQYALFAVDTNNCPNCPVLEFLLAGVSNGTLTVSAPSSGFWHHLAATYDGSSLMSLYIDGQLATQQLASGAMPIVTDSLAIGNKPGGSSLANFFAGDIDDVRIYGSALAPSQISALYNTDSVGDGIADWWREQYFGNSSATDSTSCASCDYDGTGQNNMFKYVAGLDPTDPTQVFALNIASVTNEPSQNNLFFAPLALGRTYTPQFSTDLTSRVWLPLTTYTGPLTNSDGTQVSVIDTNPIPPQEFYRIQISLPQ